MKMTKTLQALIFCFFYPLFAFNQTYKQYENLYLKEKNFEKKAYYAIVLTLDKKSKERKELEQVIDKAALQYPTIALLKKVKKISKSFANSGDELDIKEIERLIVKLNKYKLHDFEYAMIMCQAFYYSQQNNFSKASMICDDVYIKVKQKYFKNKTSFLAARNYTYVTTSIAFHYFKLGDFDRAAEYFVQLINCSDIKNQPNDYEAVLMNLSVTYLSNEEYLKALNSLNKAAEILKGSNRIDARDWNNYYRSTALIQLHRNKEALVLINEISKNNSIEGTNYRYVPWEPIELIRAEILFESNEVMESEKILLRILNSGNLENLEKNQKPRLYEVCYQLYKRKKQFEKAMLFQDKWRSTEVEYDNQKEKENVSLQLKLVNIEKQRIKDKIQQKAKQRENQIRHENERLVNIIIGLIFIIILFSLYRAVRIAKNLRLLNQQKSENTKKIEGSLAEKEIMLKEIHHRVKNNFQIISSLLNIQSYTLHEQKFAAPLNDAKTRIHSMALIHEQMYSKDTNYASIDFKNYIETLIDHLQESYGTGDMKLNKEIHIVALPINLEKAIPIGLFCNEVFTNAFKYGKSANNELYLHVSLTQIDGMLLLKIKDQGAGFGSAEKSSKSIGQELKNVLAQQLEGELVEYNENGAVVELHFTI